MFHFLNLQKLRKLTHLVILLLDDDFTDFQAAPVQASASPGEVTQPAIAGKKPNLMDMLNTTSVQPPAHVGYTQPQQPVGYGMGGMGMGMGGSMGVGGNMGGAGIGMMGMNMGGHRQTPPVSSNPSQFSSPMLPQLHPQQTNLLGGGSAPMKPTTMGGSRPSVSNSSPAAQTKSANFDDLWSMSIGGGTSSSAKLNATTASKSIKDLEKEKAQAGIWGTQQKPVGGAPLPVGFGGFGNAPPSTSGNDDLLL